MEIAVFNSFDNHSSTNGMSLIVEVQLCQSSSYLAECLESRMFSGSQGNAADHSKKGHGVLLEKIVI